MSSILTNASRTKIKKHTKILLLVFIQNYVTYRQRYTYKMHYPRIGILKYLL
jgi:hypothetical protein